MRLAIFAETSHSRFASASLCAAAVGLAELGAVGIDLNCACPSRTVVANGAGGYWLDLVPFFYDAVETSRVSAEALLGELYEGDALKDRARAILASLVETESRLKDKKRGG